MAYQHILNKGDGTHGPLWAKENRLADLSRLMHHCVLWGEGGTRVGSSKGGLWLAVGNKTPASGKS